MKKSTIYFSTITIVAILFFYAFYKSMNAVQIPVNSQYIYIYEPDQQGNLELISYKKDSFTITPIYQHHD